MLSYSDIHFVVKRSAVFFNNLGLHTLSGFKSRKNNANSQKNDNKCFSVFLLSFLKTTCDSSKTRNKRISYIAETQLINSDLCERQHSLSILRNIMKQQIFPSSEKQM